jgi:hypothetical protein
MQSFQQFYKSRCYETPNGLKPHFWQVKKIDFTAPTLFNDDTKSLAENSSVVTAISKIIALGLLLEIPVGEFVLEATKLDIPKEPFLMENLKANIADEGSHYKGFNLARRYTCNEHIAEAQLITNRFMELQCNPIEVAQALETGVFLVTLGYLRIAGGKGLYDMAYQIAKDEFRHIAVNRGYLALKNLPLVPTFLSLILEVLSWVFNGINIDKSLSMYELNKDFFVNAGKELITTGVAKKLNTLVNFTSHVPPFEVSNGELYNRSLEI